MLFDKQDIDGFEVFFENYPDQIFKARLEDIVKIALAEGFPITIILDTNESDKIENLGIAKAAGFTVRVNILFKKERSSKKVIIPVTAVVEPESQNKIIVWVLDRSTMTVNKREVKLGNFASQTTVEVTEGLKNGEWVVTAGLHNLKEGQKVKNLPPKL